MKIPHIISTILITLSATLHAATSGVFTYELEGETIRITQVAEGLTGHLEIPSHIDGKKVTHLGTGDVQAIDPIDGRDSGGQSFNTGFTSVTIPNTVKYILGNCFNLSTIKEVTIPASVTHLGTVAFSGSHIQTLTFEGDIKVWGSASFYDCDDLKAINFHDSMKSLGTNTFFTCPGLTHVKLPFDLEIIDERLFFRCSNLVSVSMGPNVKTVESEAFSHCDRISSILFLDDAPECFNTKTISQVFGRTSENCKVFFKEGKTGFSTPTWKGKPSIMIPTNEAPRKTWLRINDLPITADMASDPNKDGVSLLAEYALRLNPAQNNSKAVPTIKFENNTAKITFFNGRSDIEYTPQHSTTLNNWSSTNLTMTQKSSGEMVASTPTTNNTGFFRIQIKQKIEQ